LVKRCYVAVKGFELENETLQKTKNMKSAKQIIGNIENRVQILTEAEKSHITERVENFDFNEDDIDFITSEIAEYLQVNDTCIHFCMK